MQLLMGGSEEFGFHPGLAVFPGRVIRFESPRGPRGGLLKVPQVGWNNIRRDRPGPDPWVGTPLEGLSDGTWMYFVHSFHVLPDEADLSLSVSSYGQAKFCSSIRRGNVFACQYHPERSGPAGLEVYRRFAALARDVTTRSNDADGHPRQI
jgi:glutamine amidotransferase